MELIVVLDDKEGATDKAYKDAFVVRGIPTAFVIDKGGRIAWLGHSMDGLDDALDQILAGKYDLEAARKADKERRVLAEKQAKVLEQIDKYFELVSGSDKPEGADKLGKEVFEAAGKDASLLNQLAWEILTREGVKFRDLKLAVQVAKAAYDACEGKSAAIVDTYARALFDTGKVKEAIEHQKQAVKLAEDPEMRAELEETLKRYEQAAGR
jgi:tetratricopeptide (TPR) repeat protein